MSLTVVGDAQWRGDAPAVPGELGVPVDHEGYVREVYEGSYRRLVVQVFGVVGDRAEAEDAVQEAFARAVAAGSRFRRVDNPEAWLRTVALNVARRRWRRARMFDALRPRLADPATVPEVSAEHLAVLAALQALPQSQREVSALCYFGDLSVGEIAATLGVAPGTVKSRLMRGRAALAESADLRTEAER